MGDYVSAWSNLTHPDPGHPVLGQKVAATVVNSFLLWRPLTQSFSRIPWSAMVDDESDLLSFTNTRIPRCFYLSATRIYDGAVELGAQ